MNPTHVGMDPRFAAVAATLTGEPHARGDGPAHPDLTKEFTR
ncbi:hypothetical protein B005_2174 [Nocardiopsis alba ATCC BAA-2165]|uniref:Uncharacterized protein n=1 Tax=Nocardiopsis alba (strain ATCC BAA-2165 / BE74) TaxID=1205910 RepID=J7L6V6_NOCAA|nr:hypothetical protein B005_2174 [Nocardiopsis alba ATCC BAA-2165]